MNPPGIGAPQPEPSNGAGAEERLALLMLAERQHAEERNQRLKRRMIYLPLGAALIGFAWAAIYFLKLILR